MPVHKIKGGYQFGTAGKVYPTRGQAAAQGIAIKAREADAKKARGKRK